MQDRSPDYQVDSRKVRFRLASPFTRLLGPRQAGHSLAEETKQRTTERDTTLHKDFSQGNQPAFTGKGVASGMRETSTQPRSSELKARSSLSHPHLGPYHRGVNTTCEPPPSVS